MNCVKCGAENDDNSRFCKFCGEPFLVEEEIINDNEDSIRGGDRIRDYIEKASGYNYINLIQLIIIGLNSLISIYTIYLCFADGSIYNGNGVLARLTVLLGYGCVFGPLFVLWRVKKAILGTSVLSFIIYVIGAPIVTIGLATTEWWSLILVITNILYALYLIKNIKNTQL